jgi:hypothetical protein
MQDLIVIQFILDIILFLILLRFFLFNKSKSPPKVEPSLIELSDSIKELLGSSEQISNKIAEQKRIAIHLENLITKRKQEFEILVERAESAADIFNTVLNSSSSPVKNREEKYTLVKKLAESGMSRDEIAKSTGVLKGEVELILNLNH